MKLFNEKGELVYVYAMTDQSGCYMELVAIPSRLVISHDEMPIEDEIEDWDWDELMICKYMDDDENIDEFYYIERL